MNLLFTAVIAVTTLVWGIDVATTVWPAGVHPLWVVRQESVLLTGLLSIAMMSLAMLLATRPIWLEAPLGGMDWVYRAHKWAGLLAGLFAILHWLADQAGGPIKSLIGKAGRPPKVEYEGLLGHLQHLAKDMGEWTFYAIVALLLIALWKKFPYRPWRLLHRVMPVLYLILAVHAVLLSPPDYWRQPVGWLVAVLLAVGTYAALCALRGAIGRGRRAVGEIVSIEQPSRELITVSCCLRHGWRGHRPGQFAFVTFDVREGAHPFTIASADRGDGCVTFQIKALGDYTRQLATRLRPGQAVQVEGPYGCFDLARADRRAQQIWVAGGVGVTPFLAWLESLQAAPEQAPVAELHYCTRDRDGDPFVARLERLCAGLPSICLQVHGERQGQRLDADGMMQSIQTARRSEVWFCGPNGLAAALRAGLRRWRQPVRFHQEAFEMR
ncbi:ferric reductase-like transmembrane domain-containing protein [Azonexus sp.]|jgi:predicted ferric reductase|uniref:ferredoxin reductase family protein n=1 Tax=Azonexus sp. TaxID=1872668 RepID=UPI00281CE031|nr:ferric reductase-like transmembrane domain-containing protein [Azonexus sp.]MDR1994522.1 ferric reductase-like transmembrane domain-containing protein [Azonexus sp.]